MRSALDPDPKPAQAAAGRDANGVWAALAAAAVVGVLAVVVIFSRNTGPAQQQAAIDASQANAAATSAASAAGDTNAPPAGTADSPPAASDQAQ